MSPWGSGPEPAEHDFMRRLFRRWDADMTDSLSLQNVVAGLAAVKGSNDIMSNISYFFELYDDDGDGRVDREGILRISEALLFLSRRGLSQSPSPSSSTVDVRGGSPERSTRNEQFLSSVSAFIRRCFEYADPDHQFNQENESLSQAKDDLDSFAIGDDEDDLIDFGSAPQTPTAARNEPLSPTPSGEQRPNLERKVSTASETAARTGKAEAANAALDPNKPLYITLPTFRMVILADEVLEHFFEAGFSSSFRLSDTPLQSHASSSSNLTTFTNAGKQMAAATSGMGGVVGGAGAGVVPPGKGLRGMLGMRVAAEVRRRMDEAQKEMDREARHGREEDDEEEESHAKDADLLEGAETADVDTSKGSVPALVTPEADAATGEIKTKRNRTASDASRRVLEFER
jgi:hypothetical protein